MRLQERIARILKDLPNDAINSKTTMRSLLIDHYGEEYSDSEKLYFDRLYISAADKIMEARWKTGERP